MRFFLLFCVLIFSSLSSANARISVSPDSIDFGEVPIHDYRIARVTISYPVGSNIRFLFANDCLSTALDVRDYYCLPPNNRGSSCTFLIDFVPRSDYEILNCRLWISDSNNPEDKAIVRLHGSSFAPEQ